MEKNKPIKIAQVMGKMNYGGVEAVVMNYYRNINKNIIQFDFIVDEDSILPQKEEIEKLGGNIIIVPKYQNIICYLKEIYKVMKKGKYTIVHSHMNTLSVFPLLMAKLAGVPVRIAHSHSTEGKGEWKRNILKGILKKFSKIFATNYFACSNYSGKWLFGEKAYEQGKITIIHNAIEIDKFKYQPEIREQKRKELGVENNFVIGHIGRFMPQKNHTFLIEIFNEIYQKRKDAVLILIGDGKLEDEIKQKVEQLKIVDACRFLGNRNDVAQIYQAMDIFVLPSLYEGLPVVGIEAQTAGLKTFISSSMTEESKILETTEIIDLEEGKEEWARKIQNAQSVERIKMSEEVKRCGYDIKEEAKKLENIYQKLEKEYEEK